MLKKLHTKVSVIVRGGGEEKTNFDWIDLKSRRSISHALDGGSGNIRKTERA